MLTGCTLLLLFHCRGRTDSPVQCEILSISATSKYILHIRLYSLYSFNSETTVIRPQLVYRRSINVRIKCYQKLKLSVISILRLQGPIQHSGNKITVISEWQGEVMKLDNGLGKTGSRLLATTAPSKRSSAARTRSATSGVLLGRYPILRILFKSLSSLFLSFCFAKPTKLAMSIGVKPELLP